MLCIFYKLDVFESEEDLNYKCYFLASILNLPRDQRHLTRTPFLYDGVGERY